MRALTLLSLSLPTLAAPAFAAQVVATELQPSGGVSPALARALDGILLEELGRREGVSVISQADVRALLELEANKQALGCDDTKCLTEIAGSLGAELLVDGKVSRVGQTFVVALAMIDAQSATVVRRTTGRAKGPDDVAPEAVAAAVHNLFRGGIPAQLSGPASLTPRGFKAALAGYWSAVVDRAGDPMPSRKRIVFDLVNTELDYDTKPKIDMLDLEIRRKISTLRTNLLIAEDAGEFEHRMRGIEHYYAINDDLGRVREIRERARARGVVPSARPLRFLKPDRGARTTPELRAKYAAAAKAPREVVARALAAYLKNDTRRFAAEFSDDQRESAAKTLSNDRAADARYDNSYELLPLHAHTGRLYEYAERALERGEMLVFLRKFRAKEIYGSEQIRLIKAGKRWRISSW